MKGLCKSEKELLKMFCDDINDIPILSKEDEYKMAKQAHSGSKEAFHSLIKSNLKFVLKKAYQYWTPRLSLMDLISEGCIGLMVALKTYDPDKGYRFLTYAESSIIHRIIYFIKRHQKHELCSLDEPVFDIDERETQKDLILSDDISTDKKVFYSDIRELLNQLSNREKNVLILRYWHDLTLDEAGEKIGLTKESVRRIENRSLRKLRRIFYRERVSFNLESNYVMT
jgi:RNA polymerase primary sigma factor